MSHGFSSEKVAEFKQEFEVFDQDRNGHITAAELTEVFKALGEAVPGYRIREMIKEVDKDMNGTVEFDEFLSMMAKVQSEKTTYGLADVSNKAKNVIKIEGSSSSATGTTHSFSEEEKISFCDWINCTLKDDPDLQSLLPIAEEGMALFESVHNGILLCKLINSAVADTIDERAINKKKLNVYTIQENNILVVNSASAIGCNIVNIGAEDLIAGKPHLVLGLTWQIIRIGLLSKISLKHNPNLAVLLHEGESLADLLRLSPEELLMRWVNYHLEQANSKRRINNFSGDIKDSVIYIDLINQIAPADAGVTKTAISFENLSERASAMLDEAGKIGCKAFVRPKDVVSGNAKLNLAFVANLFNTCPALEPSEDESLPDFDLGDFNETREEKTFRNWMNSLGVQPFVNNLYTDLNDGLILLELLDQIKPGVVDWGKVNKPPFKMGGQMKMIENCNYLIDLARSLKFSLVGIGGTDINTGNRTLTLALVWQMMRAYTIRLLEKLAGMGKKISDDDIVRWANETLKSAGKSTSISSFKDLAIATSHPVIDLVDVLKPGSINYELITPGATDEDKLQNAKYAISMSRKIGARIYALAEDLVEVKPKMVMTVFACLMVKAYQK